MRISALCTAVVTYVVIGHPPPAVAQVDQQRAQEYFKEAQALCERDGGRLWGVSICAPMVIGDARTQTIATSQPAPDAPRPRAARSAERADPVGRRDVGGVHLGRRGQLARRVARRELFLHESFHCVQPQLGLMRTRRRANEHLDAVDGRYWLRLEWRALARALRESGERACRRRPRRARLPPGSAHALPRQSRRASAPWRSRKASPRTRGTVLAAPSRGRRDRARARSLLADGGGRRKASFARLRTRPVRRMASCSMHRLPAGRDGARHRRSRHARDACARGSTGR